MMVSSGVNQAEDFNSDTIVQQIWSINNDIKNIKNNN